MISFNIILPEMNQFITNLGGINQKGLIITLFTISAAISRPFSGKLSDTIGRKKVMIFGMIVGVLVTLLYPLSGLVTFLSLRFLHGFSAGFLPTGATALVTDILPPENRGVGMGVWGTFISAGIGVGQIIASWITLNWGLDVLFMVAASFGVISGIMVTLLKETLPNPQPFKWTLLKIKWNDVVEPSVIPAAIVMFCSAISTGLVFVVTPDICGFLGINNKGWFFGFYVISTVLIRLFVSGLSDKIGRRKTLIIGLSFMVISMSMIAFSATIEFFTISSIVFGISTGISSPTLFAWMADLSHEDRRGIGAGTLFIALEVGIMLGALSTLVTYNNAPDSILRVFIFGVSFSVLAIIYLIWHLHKRDSIT
ncbi:MAG: MFS transporter [Crocinitomicaceae bacterium]|nr:MFS transporter [Crocinitomicaceae bacterium]